MYTDLAFHIKLLNSKYVVNKCRYTFLAVVGVSTIVFVLWGVSGALATGVFKASAVAVGDRLSALGDFLVSKT